MDAKLELMTSIEKSRQWLADLAAFMALLPSGIDCAYTHSSELSRSVYITIPWNPATFATLRRQLGHGWQLVHKPSVFTDNGSGTMHRQYRHTDNTIRLIVVLNATERGATCQRVQVGERVEPVYEIRCGAGAQ